MGTTLNAIDAAEVSQRTQKAEVSTVVFR